MPELHPGDHLLYGVKDFFGWVTSVKTWSPAVHIEIYAGNNQSYASRNGIGVNLYPFRKEQLIAVLRPNQPVNLKLARDWFDHHACGQKYDWLGLLCFTLAVSRGSPDRMFCSEFATRWCRAAGFNAIHPAWDADKVAPGSFLMSPAFGWIWADRRVLKVLAHGHREKGRRLIGPLAANLLQ